MRAYLQRNEREVKMLGEKFCSAAFCSPRTVLARAYANRGRPASSESGRLL